MVMRRNAASKHFGECLKASVPATDTIARLAGDEFVVLLPGLHESADAEIRLYMRGRRYDALFASADEALYAAKNGDRDTFKVMECNVIDLAHRPSRRRSDARQRNEVGASSRDS